MVKFYDFAEPEGGRPPRQSSLSPSNGAVDLPLDDYDESNQDPEAADAEPIESQTQLQTQTQFIPASRRDYSQRYAHTWGRLIPCDQGAEEFLCYKTKLEYTIGRSEKADFKVKSPRISNIHCYITYHPEQNAVVIRDTSRNGTYVEGQPVKNGCSIVLTGASEVCLGRPSEMGLEDWRYTFRFPEMPNPDMGGGLWEEYQQLEVLGKGAFGTVRKIMSKTTGKFAAVKIFAKSRFFDQWEKFMKGYMTEVEILSRLHHHNLVAFYGHYEDEMSLYIVMELVTGGDLLNHITGRPDQCLGEDETKKMAKAICEALAYSHSIGVSHRDLKPENILITASGEPKVADFGLGKIVDSQTFLRTMCGTPAYLAPEVLENDPRGYSEKVDSWSMGVIVVAMLTGRGAIVEGEEEDFMTRMRGRALDTDLIQEAACAPEGKDWIFRMLSTNPNQRLSMQQALMHPWLRDVVVPRKIETPPSIPSFSGLNNNQMRQTAALQASSSFDSTGYDTNDTSSTTPTTPGMLPRPLQSVDNCSQELEALALQTNTGFAAAGQPSVGSMSGLSSTDSVNYHPSLSDFPSVPGMPYPIPRTTSGVQDESPLQINALQSAWSVSKIGTAPKMIDDSMNSLVSHNTIRPTTRGKRKVRPTSQPPSSSPVPSEPPSSPRSAFDDDDSRPVEDSLYLTADEGVGAPSDLDMSIDRPGSSSGSRSATGDPMTPTRLRSRRSFPLEGQTGPPMIIDPFIKPIKASRPAPAPPSANLRPRKSAAPKTPKRPDAKRRKVSAPGNEETSAAPVGAAQPKSRNTRRSLAATTNDSLNLTKVPRTTRGSVAAGGPQRR